jgi:L-lactate dehydrogenase complex protein LldG
VNNRHPAPTTMPDSVLDKVKRALARREPLSSPPVPPAIEEPIARLVYSDIGLVKLFHKRATGMKMLVEMVHVEDVLEKTATFLRERKCKSVMLSDTPLIQRLGVCDHLARAGFAAHHWKDMTADQAYDIDAGVTDADYAVAETGTLAIRHRPEHGRLLSLVPFVHVAIIEPRILVPDLIDLFERLKAEGTGSGVTLISGPSKTADIEMNTVTGVHGPNVVKTFVLS